VRGIPGRISLDWVAGWRGIRSQGTIVDATLINAPSSTKNKDGKRDPEMHQTKKGKQYCVSRTQVK
jgi:IS5 family transposase